jgi:hypothetical protein
MSAEPNGEFQRVPNALLEQCNARIDDLERQLATVAQETIERCAKVALSRFEYSIATAIRALKESEQAQVVHGSAQADAADPRGPNEATLDAAPAPASGPAIRVPWRNPALALTAGGVCAKCGFTYWEHNGHIIACPVCECERLRAVADAANAFVPHWNRTWDEDEDPTIQQETGDALVAAVRALERGEVKS